MHLTALADSDETSLSRARAKVDSAEFFSDWKQLLSRAEIDAAFITLPTSLHAGAAEAAFDRGVHVYVEKPLGVSCAETLAALRRWRESGKVGVTGFNFRFSPQFESARKMIAEGRIGEVLGTHTTFTSRGTALPKWKKDRRSGGGALLDLASHHFDLLPWLLDRQVNSVTCALNSVQSEDDTSSIQLTLEGGIVSQIFTSIAGADEHRLEISGREGTLMIDLNRSDGVEITGPTLKKARLSKLSGAAKAFSSPAYWAGKIKGGVSEVSFERSLNSFVCAAIEGRSVRPNLYDGYRSLTIVEAAEKSARQNCNIEIPFTTDEDITR